MWLQRKCGVASNAEKKLNNGYVPVVCWAFPRAREVDCYYMEMCSPYTSLRSDRRPLKRIRNTEKREFYNEFFLHGF